MSELQSFCQDVERTSRILPDRAGIARERLQRRDVFPRADVCERFGDSTESHTLASLETPLKCA